MTVPKAARALIVGLLLLPLTACEGPSNTAESSKTDDKLASIKSQDFPAAVASEVPSYRGPDIPRAKELLAKAGYPGGEGLPEIEYYVTNNSLSKQMADMMQRQLQQINVRLKPIFVDFPTLISTVNNKQAPFFGFAWKSDYPDAENNLALFYGPNESPGSNHYNYKRPEYDRLYEKIRTMAPSEERTELYIKMRNMIIEDCPYVGSSARTAYVVVRPQVRNYKPTDIFDNWYKYIDIEKGAGGDSKKGSAGGEKVLRMAMPTTGPKTLDPVKGSTVYENRAASQVYETLLQYNYLLRPPKLEPLLLAKMPEKEEVTITGPDGEQKETVRYRFTLKPGVRFHDNPCFPGGKGREVVSSDVFYSWKRMADEDNKPKSWWLIKNTIAGFDQYREEQNQADAFDYEAPVSGFEIINDREFTVTLTEPIYRFFYVLAMFQTAVVPREAVEHYGDAIDVNPVGTGPFTLHPDQYELNQKITFEKNPDYHGTYPTEHMPEDVEAGLTDDTGKQLPLVDRIEIAMISESQPMWLEFKAGNLDMTPVPFEFLSEAINKRTGQVKPAFAEEGVKAYSYKTLDFIFRGFNMEDELLGGYTEKDKALRQAISLAIDLDEMSRSFYEGTLLNYDGPIPPGLEGHPEVRDRRR